MIVLRCPVFLVLTSLERKFVLVLLSLGMQYISKHSKLSMSFGNVIVLEQHYFLNLVSIDNPPLDKLRVCVAS